MKLFGAARATLAILVAMVCCAPLARAGAEPAEKPEPKKPADPAAVHAKAADELIAKMASDSQEVRKRAELAYEKLIFHAGRPGAEAERAAAVEVIVDRLGRDVPKAAVLILLEALEYIGREDAVERLGRLIGHADPLVRERARRALQANPSPKALEALRAALVTAQTPAWKIALINALGARRDRASVAALIPLARSGDQAVRTHAVEALARIGDKRALEAITEASTKAKTPRAWQRALVAYLALADALADAGDKATALRMYRHLLGAKGYLRAGAIVGLGRAGSSAEIPVLLAALGDDDAKVRGAAEAALDALPVEEVTRALTKEAEAAAPRHKAILLRVLAGRADKRAMTAFIAAASDADELVRHAAYEALGKLGDDRALPVLLTALAKAKGSKERAVARSAIDRIQSPTATRALIDAMKEAAPTARGELIDLLAGRRATAAVPALLEAASDKDPGVRSMALRALGTLGDATTLPPLVDLLGRAKAARDRAAAEKAIVAVAKRIEDPRKAAEPVLAALGEADVAARCALLRVAGRIGGDKALAALRAARTDRNAKVQDAAIRALVDWPTPEVLDDLLDLARSASEQTHRVLALRGYVRVAGLVRGRTTEQMVKLYEDAMAVARRPEDKKRVLAGVAALANLGALRMAQRYLDDEALKSEAAAAVVAIAKTIFGIYRDEAKGALETAILAITNPQQVAQAKTIMAHIGKLGDYLTAWEAAGPFTVPGKTGQQLLDEVFPPEKPGDTTAVWRVIPPGGYPKKPQWPWAMDLLGFLGGEERAGYLRTKLFSPKKQQVVIELGSDDGCKVWLNGKVVHTVAQPRSLKPGEDRIRVTLEEGWNTLLIKVVQGAIDWGAAARLTAPDGRPAEGVRANPFGK